jgi:hypothetical protein
VPTIPEPQVNVKQKDDKHDVIKRHQSKPTETETNYEADRPFPEITQNEKIFKIGINAKTDGTWG